MHNVIRYIGTLLLIQMVWVSSLFPLSLEQKYPSYSYVFNEFDVDESYLYDEGFISFVMQKENGLKAFYQHALLRGEEILPMMQGLLVDDGVSDLFIYLSMVESGFSVEAVSPKKAVGLWQFMPATAKHYDLIVHHGYDERYDTVSATTAAIRYLDKLHKQFGKWYLAAMAYNCGEGCLERAIRRAGTDDITVLTDERLKYLPRETRHYIKKLLLLAMIGENAALDFYGETAAQQKKLIEVEVHEGTTLREIASLLKMKEERLVALNRSLRDGVVPPGRPGFKITIPIEKIYAFYLRYQKSLKPRTYRSHMVSHNVSLGETLEGIAKMYEADKEEIKRSNHLSDEYLLVDSLLVIPVSQKVFEKISQ